MEAEIAETTKSGAMVRTFTARVDKRLTAHDVMALDGLPKTGDRRKGSPVRVVSVTASQGDPKPQDDGVEWHIEVEYESRRRKILMFICDRANWGRLQPLARAIQEREDLELQILAGGSTVLHRFGRPVDTLPCVAAEVYSEIEGSIPLTQARSCGLAMMDYAAELHRLKPDILLLVGDRYQALAAITAAATMNICTVHLQGGEISGSADEVYRHMISKAAMYHVPATENAAANLLRMGERPETILAVGCPSADLAADVMFDDEPDGDILCVYHPTTTEGDNAEQMLQVLKAVAGVPHGCTLLWPNIDAGSDKISKTIRVWMDQYKAKGLSLEWLTTVKNLPPEEYLKRLANTRCAVGNSSSFVRDSSHFGTPVVLVGNRQQGRECGPNVIRVPCQKDAISAAITEQLEHGRYPGSDLYGEPGISEVIAERLAALELYSQKRLHYPVEVTT